MNSMQYVIFLEGYLDKTRRYTSQMGPNFLVSDEQCVEIHCSKKCVFVGINFETKAVQMNLRQMKDFFLLIKQQYTNIFQRNNFVILYVVAIVGKRKEI